MNYLREFTWAFPDKSKAVGPKQRIDLHKQIDRLKNNIKKRMTRDPRQSSAEELLSIMIRKSCEATLREGKMDREAKKLNKAACKLEVAKHEGAEIDSKFQRLRKAFLEELATA